MNKVGWIACEYQLVMISWFVLLDLSAQTQDHDVSESEPKTSQKKKESKQPGESTVRQASFMQICVGHVLNLFSVTSWSDLAEVQAKWQSNETSG